MHHIKIKMLHFRLGKVCKLWHSVSCRAELWKQVDLAQYTSEKCKTDYKLVWLLENRLSHCQSLNIGKRIFHIVKSYKLLIALFGMQIYVHTLGSE